MRLEELFEQEEPNLPTTDKKLVVVYGGRFQPFHRGHYQVYLWLCKRFGKGNVWIATSDKTNFKEKEGDISPFTYEEKVEIITSLYDIPPRKIIECKNPAFSPIEVFEQYKGFKVVYLAAVGKKDEERYKESGFYLPLPADWDERDVAEMVPFKEKKAYYVEVPMKRGGVSGTKVREELKALKEPKNDEEKRELKKIFKEYFGRYDPIIADLMIAKIKEIKK